MVSAWAGWATDSLKLAQKSHIYLKPGITWSFFWDIAFGNCFHVIAGVNEPFFNLWVQDGFYFGVNPQRWADLIFQWAEHKTQKLGFVSSYFQLSTVWSYLLLPAQEAACCCCRRDCMKETTWWNMKTHLIEICRMFSLSRAWISLLLTPLSWALSSLSVINCPIFGEYWINLWQSLIQSALKRLSSQVWLKKLQIQH